MTRIQSLVQLMEVKYHSSQQGLQSVLKQETTIRTKLNTLANHAFDAHNISYESKPEMRSLGADMVWERWLERTRIQLNLELANILVTKEAHLSIVRRSFGKLQIARKMAQANIDKQKRMRHTLDLDNAIFQATYRI